MTTPSDPGLALLRSRSYVALLVLAALIGVPVSAAAYFFLALVSKMQAWIFTRCSEAKRARDAISASRLQSRVDRLPRSGAGSLAKSPQRS